MVGAPNRGLSWRRAWPFVALLLGGSAIGFAPILVRLSDVGPVASAFWRLALAVPLLWLWVATREPAAGAAPRASSSPLWFAGLFFAADLGVWHWSIQFTSVANATLLANLAPIFVTLGAWWLFRERITGLFLFGMIVALTGTVLLVGTGFSIGGARLGGDALAGLAAVFYAGYMLAIKRAREFASTARLMAFSTSVSAILLLPIAVLSPQPMLPSGADGWLVLAGLALVTQVVGQGLIAYAFAHLPATLSAVSLLIQPVVAAALAWWIFGEALGAWQFLGGALVLSGIYLTRRVTRG